MSELARRLVSLLFCSSHPVSADELAEALECEAGEVQGALAEIDRELAEGASIGLVLRNLADGWTLASAPEAEVAIRRLLAKPRTPPLSQAQAECLAVTAYLRRVSRPEIARIRGVNSDSAMATLEERGLIDECGRSRFGASSTARRRCSRSCSGSRASTRSRISVASSRPPRKRTRCATSCCARASSGLPKNGRAPR